MGTPQAVGDWLSRGVFFLLIGQFMAAVMTRQRRSEGDLQRSHDVLRTMADRLEPHRRAEEIRRLRIGEITTVIEGGGVDAVFQPIVDLGRGGAVGVEALARFQSRPGQSPGPLFAQAWEVGLGVEFEMTALQAALRWLGDVPERLWASVNLSPDVIASEVFEEAIWHLPLDRIVFEITEHARIEDYDSFGVRLLELRARGARLAIDDVGAGFASLRHIRLLRPEVIKMDRTLIQGIEEDPALQALAGGLVLFGRHLGASVVAEGIETEAELETLQRLDVSYGQGYLLARPSPLPALNFSRLAFAS
ncbi:MAG: EAL domain-containing protein [Actinomycetota bacterium]